MQCWFSATSLQESCAGRHQNLESVFAARGNALVGVEKDGQTTVRFVDFIPVRQMYAGVYVCTERE